MDEPQTLTPPEIASRYRVNADKVLSWIRSGELAAIDVSTRPGGRPRWRITSEAIEDFERRRAAKPAVKTSRRRRQAEVEVEYV